MKVFIHVTISGGCLASVECSDPEAVYVLTDEDNIEAGDPAPDTEDERAYRPVDAGLFVRGR